MVATGWRSWGWKIWVVSSLAMGGAIACFGSGAKAQITPDGTLGAESSQVTSPTPGGFQIDGGATRGTNLFHSFEQFSVPTGGSAHFNNALNIQNIFSRVTGGSVSNIDGLIRANPSANLFLLNPNGIIFGPNATLSIGGSILASTASSLNFADGTQFSATAHPTTPQLTVSVPLGLQFGGTVGSIQYDSQATNSSANPGGLQVSPGKTLALVGGDVSLDGGTLQAPGGRVELGGVASSGTVGLFVDSNSLQLSFPDNLVRSSILLTNGAEVNVRAPRGGSIAINAQNLNLTGTSTLRVGINSDSVSMNSLAGDIEINATGTINLTDESSIVNDLVDEESVGNGGNINITTGSLYVTNGAQLVTSPKGQGDAGSVNINARDTISFDGVGINGIRSGAFSSVSSEAVGNAGDIIITTGSLSVTDGAQLSARTFGRGNAGSVTINVGDRVSFDGGFSGAFSSVETTGSGNGGGINITTESLSVTNGAVLRASTFGRGNAGSVTINVGDRVSFDGGFSGAFSGVGTTGSGNGGGINITTESLSVTNGAVLSARTFGRGNAGSVTINVGDRVSFDGGSSGAFSGVETTGSGNGGDITIVTRSLALRNGAQLAANSRGQGNAGSVTINARDHVSFSGVSKDGSPSRALTNVGSLGAVGNAGDAGDITIVTRSLALSDGAELAANNNEQGNAGSVTINARDHVSFSGVRNDGSSGAFTSVGSPRAVGNGGDIRIVTRSLALRDGAQLSARTRGQGNAGSVIIEARDRVSFDGVNEANGSRGVSSGALSTVEETAAGNGGDITITTESLSVTNGAELSASSKGSGAAGNIEITARSINLENNARLSSNTTGGQGNINLRSQSLVLRRESSITTKATGTATGGNITIDTGVIAALENSDISASASEGSGGRITINGQGIFGTEFRDTPTPESDITATSDLGPDFSGTVEINTPDIDPSRGLFGLAEEVVDVAGLINQNFCVVGGSSFTVTGRGGKPPSPNSALNTDATWEDWRLTAVATDHRANSARNTQPPLPMAEQLVEATGWVLNDKGSVVLIATAPTVTPHGWVHPPSGCKPLTGN